MRRGKRMKRREECKVKGKGGEREREREEGPGRVKTRGKER